MVVVSSPILTERRLRNGLQGHSLTPSTVHRKETAIIYTQAVDRSLRLYEPTNTSRDLSVLRRNICYLYGNTARADNESVFLHNTCSVSS